MNKTEEIKSILKEAQENLNTLLSSSDEKIKNSMAKSFSSKLASIERIDGLNREFYIILNILVILWYDRLNYKTKEITAFHDCVGILLDKIDNIDKNVLLLVDKTFVKAGIETYKGLW